METTRRVPAVGGRELLAALAFVAIVNAVGASPALLGGPNSAWFAALEKPWFYPPAATFGIVWTLLFTLQGIALWLVWRRGTSRPDVRAALAAFVVQFLVNLAWTPAFFTLQNPPLGLAIIAALFVAVIATLAAFARVDRRAAALLVPYLLWVGFAAVLNYELWRLNG
ncbi:TspO/MBR family protein [Halegenticoccus tardaugens]|uniref:TspO/MBR family protein n=1 Tax=Halegenticoccus tardaugens TaxID=2071624 RepID=UPI00100B25DB|nr:TspO/MBR family protein [Halegenticoccus tardaugens]